MSFPLCHGLVRVFFLYSPLSIFLSLNFLFLSKSSNLNDGSMGFFQRFLGPKAMLADHEKLCLAYDVVKSSCMLTFSQLLKCKNRSFALMHSTSCCPNEY